MASPAGAQEKCQEDPRGVHFVYLWVHRIESLRRKKRSICFPAGTHCVELIIAPGPGNFNPQCCKVMLVSRNQGPR
jgi:hypothetical protein